MIRVKDKKLYSLIKELIRIIAGKNSEPIVDILFQKKNVNEFKIADKLGITINQARNIIYKLSKFNILDSIRKKDKRRGWYTYFWTLNNIKALHTLFRLKKREIQLMIQILKNRKMKNFYICSADNIEMSEETAMHYAFLCPECGELLQPVPRERKIKEISTRIEQIRRQLNAIKLELERITPKPKLKVKKKKRKIKKKKKKKPKKKIQKKKLRKILKIVRKKKKVKKKKKRKKKPKRKKIKKKKTKAKVKKKKVKKKPKKIKKKKIKKKRKR